MSSGCHCWPSAFLEPRWRQGNFDTLQQCEETVDYHGFCEQNPDMPAQKNTGMKRTYQQ
jgi:hypothetical protein